LARFGCQLPDAIHHGKRSYRPHSRAVQRLAVAEFRVRPLSPLQLAIAVAGLRTRERHVCDCVAASLPSGAGTATAFGGALARRYGSGLLSLRLRFVHMPAVFFATSPAPWKGRGPCLPRFSSRSGRFLSRLSATFVRRFPFQEATGPSVPFWCTVATIYPPGNCDSPGLETRPDYLTRLETVSHRFSPLSPFFAFTSGARTPPEEPVNFASITVPCGFYSRGDGPTSLAQPFPGRPGLSSGPASSFLRRIPSVPAEFSKVCFGEQTTEALCRIRSAPQACACVSSLSRYHTRCKSFLVAIR